MGRFSISLANARYNDATALGDDPLRAGGNIPPLHLGPDRWHTGVSGPARLRAFTSLIQASAESDAVLVYTSCFRLFLAVNLLPPWIPCPIILQVTHVFSLPRSFGLDRTHWIQTYSRRRATGGERKLPGAAAYTSGKIDIR